MMPQTDGILSRELSRRLFWRTVPLLFTVLALSNIDRAVVGYAALQMNDALGFSPMIFGIGGSVFFLGYLLAQIPVSLTVFRIGARRGIAAMMFLWGGVTTSMALVHSPHSFYAVRFALGLAEAGFGPSMFLYLSQCFPKQERAGAIGAVTTATVVALVIGGPVAGVVLETVQGFGLAPWQWLFIIEGLPTLLMGFFVLHTLSDHPANAAWLSTSQRSELLALLTREQAESGQGNVDSGWLAARDLRVWMLFLVFGCISAGFLGMTLWLPQVVHQLGDLRPFAIGLISAIPFLLGAISMYVIGRHSDRSGARYRYIVLGGVIGAAGFAASALLVTQPVLAIGALTVGMAGVSSVIGPFWSVVTGFLRREAAAVGISIVNAGSSIAGFASTLLVGWLRERSGNFILGLLLLAGLALLGALLMAVLGIRAHGQRSR